MQQTTVIRTTYSQIRIDEEGILVVKMDEDIELDLEEAKASFEAYRQLGLGAGKRVPQLLISRESSASIPADARDYVSEHGRHFFTASAVVGKSLAIRLIVNFFNAFYKHPVPFKMFENEEDAREWLRSFK